MFAHNQKLTFLTVIGILSWPQSAHSASDSRTISQQVPGAGCFDIAAQYRSNTPIADTLWLVIRVNDVDTKYPATLRGNGFTQGAATWSVNIPQGLMCGQQYKCYVMRDSPNQNAYSVYPNGAQAYSVCSVEPFLRSQTIPVMAWGDQQGNGLASTASKNIFLYTANFQVQNCPDVTFPVWIRTPPGYPWRADSQDVGKRCAAIAMFQADCYFDKSRCSKGYEFNVDDQLNKLEAQDHQCLFGFAFGSMVSNPGTNTQCKSADYIAAVQDYLNQQTSTLPLLEDPSKNILFGIGHGAAIVFQAVPRLLPWAQRCVVINPIYSKDTAQGAQNQISQLLARPHPDARNLNCVITASASDPATNRVTKPLVNALRQVAPLTIEPRFMQTKNTHASARFIMVNFDITKSFQTLVANAIKVQVCLAQAQGKKKKREAQREGDYPEEYTEPE